jgi:site-specific recombinase XerD
MVANNNPPPPKITPNSPVAEVIAHYVRYLDGKRRPATVKAYRLTYEKLLRLWEAHPPTPKRISDITADMIKPLPSWLNAQGLSRNSIDRHLAAAMQFVRFLFREELAPQIDARSYASIEATFNDARRGRKMRRIPRAPGNEAIDEVITQAAEAETDNDKATEATQRRKELRRLRDIAALEILRSAGLRVSELVALKRWNLDWEGHRLLIEVTKSKEPRAVPLDDRAWRAIQAYLKTRQPQDGATGRPLHTLPLIARHDKRAGEKVLHISTRSIQQMLKDTREEAGIDMPLTPHSMRHQLATDMGRATGNLALVQMVLGHQSPETTRGYMDLTQDDVARGMDQLMEYRGEKQGEGKQK